ncbi:hypothetical protein FB566_3475 [Stackebrandtia endophytica]|uniref:Uncharacterized protein n=1 Tax=Stackebrandtia endophytica TaxID=1496996 RepID=A0A543AZ85_9ACTN|nr:hypothetical protein [Stackebrandtia endophytica]TQL77901.1 hypothetical protein FB566_3475 [Stackebrandtia endophytica]
MPWSFTQHLDLLTAHGIVPEPLHGDGSRTNPWRDAEGRRPVRDARRERIAVREYLDHQPTGYRDTVEKIAATLPPMHPRCRISALVPCRTEAGQIGGLLSRYADQRDLTGGPLHGDDYEVLALVNRFADEPDDGTADVVNRWSGEGLRAHAAEYIHPDGEKAPLTMARKLLADVALWRSVERPEPAGPLYLASEDADVPWLDPRQLAYMITTLDGDPGLDSVRGAQDRCPWQMARHPLLVLMRRSWNFTEALVARRSMWPDRNPGYDFTWNRLNTSGWNTAFTAEVYARVGGYSRQRPFEEDMDIGEKISAFRAYRQDGQLVPQVATVGRIPTRAEGSPRRWLYWAATGTEPYADGNDYENFFRRDHERAVKDRALTELETLAETATRLDVDRLTEAMQRDLDFLTGRCGGDGNEAVLYRRVLALIGFRPGDADIDGGRLCIRSVAGVAERLARYARYADFTVGPYPRRLPLGTAANTWRMSAVRAV